MTNICAFCFKVCVQEGEKVREGGGIVAGEIGDKIICVDCRDQLRALVCTKEEDKQKTKK